MTGAPGSEPGRRILEAVVAAAEQFLRAPFTDAAITEMLERLGRAAEASRAHLFVNRQTAEGDWVVDLLDEWVDEGFEPLLGKEEIADWSYAASGNGWLFALLARGETHAGTPADFSAATRAELEAQGVVGMVNAPILTHERFWGFLGFDECRRERSWSESELAAVRLGASVLAAAVDRREAERELREREEHLRQSSRLEAWGRLAAGVARDFDALMTTIRGHGERAVARLRAGDPLRAEVSEILLAAERATELTRELVAVGRQQEARPQPLEFGPWLDQRLPMLRRIAGGEVELTGEVADPTSRIHADPRLLEQALVALVLNARDAVPEGGRIELAARAVTGSEVERRGVAEPVGAGYLRVTLRDSGPGLEPDQAEHLFEPFFGDGERGGKGRGLGLSTVYGVVRQCDGYVFADSAPGEGTTFTLFLPLAADDALAAALTEPAKPARAAGASTVLLVEDEDLIRSLAEQILTDSGYRVLPAGNASEAMEIAENNDERIDLLLTDIVMPGSSGSDLAQRLLRQHPEMKVLYMSGYSDSIIFRYGVLQDRAAFLQKPFAAEVLERKVRELIGG
ncbi:MAG TPA: ATP-binding protein [Thermoanaerobaculia bacterium]|nr:ATP-binding protein [Thermoanaerobaculia bacterium]